MTSLRLRALGAEVILTNRISAIAVSPFRFLQGPYTGDSRTSAFATCVNECFYGVTRSRNLNCALVRSRVHLPLTRFVQPWSPLAIVWSMRLLQALSPVVGLAPPGCDAPCATLPIASIVRSASPWNMCSSRNTVVIAAGSWCWAIAGAWSLRWVCGSHSMPRSLRGHVLVVVHGSVGGPTCAR